MLPDKKNIHTRVFVDKVGILWWYVLSVDSYEPHLKEKKEKKPYGKFTNIKEHHILSLLFCISRLQKTQCTSDNWEIINCLTAMHY